MLIATKAVAMPITEKISELTDKSNSDFYCSEYSNELKFVDLWTNNSRLLKIVDNFFVNTKKVIEKEASHDVVEELPIPGVTYTKLQEINFIGHLQVIEPLNMDNIELMIAISEFRLFPNYPENKIIISLNYLSNTEIRVYNRDGKLVTKILNGDINKMSVELDISKYSVGAYSVSDGMSTLQFNR